MAVKQQHPNFTPMSMTAESADGSVSSANIEALVDGVFGA